MKKTTTLHREFDRQTDTLLQMGYPKAANLAPLKEKLHFLSLPELDLERGKLPFVIVMKNGALTSEQMMERTQRSGKNGVTILRPLSSNSFKVISGVWIPDSFAYLLVDIDRGKDTRNIPPNAALLHINRAKRSPLTIDEGIAIVTHFPEFLMKNNCFSLLASRTGNDQRVPAIWINAKKEPNLGWCWDGNPHTWLGSASCAARVV